MSWDLHAYRCTPAGFSRVSVVPEAVHQARRGPLKGTVSALKSPSRVQVGDEGVAGRNGGEKYFTDMEGKLMIFHIEGTEKLS